MYSTYYIGITCYCVSPINCMCFEGIIITTLHGILLLQHPAMVHDFLIFYLFFALMGNELETFWCTCGCPTVTWARAWFLI